MVENSRFSGSPGRFWTTRAAGQVVPEPLELEGGLAVDAAGLAQPLEGERAHLLHVLVALQLLGPEAERGVERRQLHRLREQGDPLVVEAVLGVLLGDEDVLVHRLARTAGAGCRPRPA